jgi:Mlc titration factor MtfA (ptsG expression regulator)
MSPVCTALLWNDPWSGLFLGLAAILAVLVLFAWWLNRNERATRLIARLAALPLLGPLARLGKRRRTTAPAEPFPDRWVEILHDNVRYYGILAPAEREALHERIQEFLVDRQWEGCRGQAIDDEVRVTVAGQACVLLLGRPDDDFDNVSSILVYPATFRTAQHAVVGSDGRTVLEASADTLGQAVYRGPVILAWDEVVAGGRDLAGGRNVVFHEFAHQLDFGGDVPTTDTAELARRRRRQEVFGAEYARIVDDVRRGRVTLLDPYGATNPAEFFAVATECFFERPVEMRAYHPDLYRVLGEFYRQDPARRVDGTRA